MVRRQSSISRFVLKATLLSSSGWNLGSRASGNVFAARGRMAETATCSLGMSPSILVTSFLASATISGGDAPRRGAKPQSENRKKLGLILLSYLFCSTVIKAYEAGNLHLNLVY